VVAILGTTYTGHFYNVEELDAALEKLNKAKGWEVNIHVDAASGGFVAPFLYSDLKCKYLVLAQVQPGSCAPIT
jgi:glutamate decarboxylase